MYVYADSTNRDTLLYPSGNSYTLHLTTPAKSVTQVDLVAAKVPNAMYNITDGTNVISVGATDYSIPAGFYSAFGLAETLAVRLGIEVKYLPDEGRLWFYNSTSPFTVTANTSEFQKVSGLDSTVHSSQLNIYIPEYSLGPNGYIIKSDNVVDMSTNEFVFLDIDELRTTQMVDSKSLIGETYSGQTIQTTFAMIAMDVGSGCIKNFKEEHDYVISITYPQPIAKLARLTVRWYDKNGRLLNFNGFENNAFVLRIHEAPIEKEEEIKETSITELELKRLIESLIPPPKVEKKIKRIMVPRFLMYLILVIVIGMGIYTFVKSRPVVAAPNSLPQFPTVIPTPLRPSMARRII